MFFALGNFVWQCFFKTSKRANKEGGDENLPSFNLQIETCVQVRVK